MTIKVTTMLLKGLALKYSSIAFVLLTVFTLATAMLHAQTPAERVTTGIDTSERVTITGTRPTSANPANDVGPVPLAAKLQGINIVFRRSACPRSSFAGIDCGPAKSSFAALSPMAHTRAVCAQFGVSESDIFQGGDVFAATWGRASRWNLISLGWVTLRNMELYLPITKYLRKRRRQ